MKRNSFYIYKEDWSDKMRVFECANGQRVQQEMCATDCDENGRIVNKTKMIALVRGFQKPFTVVSFTC